MSLALSYDELARAVGREIDASRDADDWDAVQTQDIRDIIADGLRQVYWPPVLPGESAPHEWSFLQPKQGEITIYPSYDTGTVSAVSGVVTLSGGTFPTWAANGDLWMDGGRYDIASRQSNTQITLVDTTATVSPGTSYTLTYTYYDMPTDFGGMGAGQEFSFRRDEKHAQFPPHPKTVSEAMIDRHDQWPPRNGSPSLCTLVPKTTTTTDTRWQVRFWPYPDREYHLQYRYQVNPPLLNGTTYVHHYGGPWVSQAVLMSCLDKAMRFLYSTDEYYNRFMVALTTAVQRDRNIFGKESMGFGSYSDGYTRHNLIYDSLRDFRRANTSLGNINIGN